jgi:[acyl-carrier-protein] S-malonyltransferase
MAADLARSRPEAAAVFAVADAALADAGLPQPLSAICFEGPEDLLTATEVAQPALLTAAYACFCCARAALGEVGLTAGHSLGEYTALVVAGALDFATAVRLVRRRGELMRDCAAAHPGAMAAVLNLDDAKVAELCAATEGVVVPANFNAPGQVVISGERPAVAAVTAAAKAAGGRAVPLKVSGAFHSPLMAPAAAAMAEELASAEIRDAAVPVVQNFTAAPESRAAALRQGLADQITGSVRWTESVRAMAALGVDQVVEFGPGTVLSGLIKRTAAGLACYNVNSAASCEGLAGWLAGGEGAARDD